MATGKTTRSALGALFWFLLRYARTADDALLGRRGGHPPRGRESANPPLDVKALVTTVKVRTTAAELAIVERGHCGGPANGWRVAGSG